MNRGELGTTFFITISFLSELRSKVLEGAVVVSNGIVARREGDTRVLLSASAARVSYTVGKRQHIFMWGGRMPEGSVWHYGGKSAGQAGRLGGACPWFSYSLRVFLVPSPWAFHVILRRPQWSHGVSAAPVARIDSTGLAAIQRELHLPGIACCLISPGLSPP